MGSLVALRLLVMLRRIWKAQVQLVEVQTARLELEKQRMQLEHPEWLRAGNRVPNPKAAKKAEFNVMEWDNINAKWKEPKN